MARRTKEDAMATRDAILDAAEQLFVEQGVARTTLQHIATAAGVTRGAIYWHFEDKAALFNAMMERAKLPLESVMEQIDKAGGADPAAELRESLLAVMRMTVENPKMRRVFEIATLKLEHVAEMDAVRVRKMQSKAIWMARAENRVRAGMRQGQFRQGLSPRVVALGLYAMLDGLLRNWLSAPEEFDLVKTGTQIVDWQLDSLRGKD